MRISTASNIVISTSLALLLAGHSPLRGEELTSGEKNVVEAAPDEIVLDGQEQMLPHYGILEIGGAKLTTPAEKLLVSVYPALYVNGKIKETFGNNLVLLKRGESVLVSMSMKNFGVRWDERFGNEGPLYYVATGYDSKRQKRVFHARGEVEWPKTSGTKHRIEEVPLPAKLRITNGESTPVWAWIGEGVDSIDELTTPKAQRGTPLQRARKAEWAFVLMVDPH